MKKLLGALTALAVLVAAIWTFLPERKSDAAVIPLVSGPVESSQLLGLLNTLIGQVNQYYGYGYIKATPTNSATYSMGTFQASEFLAANSGSVTTVTINLPVGILDGARACIFTIGGINPITVSAGANSINNAVTSIAANTRVCYTYGTSNTTWDRSQ